ncbi:NfeD family protein [Luteolibacter sp. AS25]|uniref:NfeD family protein n=1 Tax=Luteolibacter sp. AS25 TaxID=3135776 RepID=UPI00398A6034
MPDFINSWWESLNFNLQFFYGIGIIALCALGIQLVMSFFLGMDDGLDLGGGDGMDLGDHDSGISIFSVKGVTAFFVGFGWTGVICTQRGFGLILTLIISLAVGFGMMMVIYLMMRSFVRLQDSGTLNYQNAVGQTGTVYVTIPPLQQAGGQVEAMIQGRAVTAQARQKGTEALTPGSQVKVVECIGASTLIVEPLG